MILLYIENLDFMKKLIYYLDSTNHKYTTDLESNYDYILISEVNQKKIDFAYNKYKEGKKIIFLTYLEENKIAYYYNKTSKTSREYLKKLNKILDISSKVFVNFEFTRKFIKKTHDVQVNIIPREIPIINISKNNKDIYNKYKIEKRKKKIIVVDEEYKNVEKIYSLANQYPKYNFVYIGYKPHYLLKTKQKQIIDKFPNNIKQIKYHNLNIFSDLCKVSDIVIFLENNNINIDYLYTTLIFKKQLIIKENILFEDFLINSKNVYTFKSKDELFLKFKKIINKRISNLTDKAYLLIVNNTFDEIVKKYNAYLT